MLLRPRDGVGPNVSLDGATEVHWDKLPADADYVIMADPEGNRFCVVQV